MIDTPIRLGGYPLRGLPKTDNFIAVDEKGFPTGRAFSDAHA
jgi:hypothetical protein